MSNARRRSRPWERSIAPNEAVRITVGHTVGYPGGPIGPPQPTFSLVNSPRNGKALSHIYREGAWPEPNRQIEQAIRATERGRRSPARRWALPFALGATALLALALIIKPVQEQPRPIAGSPPAASGPRADQPPVPPDAQRAVVEPPRSPPATARAPAPPSPTATSPFAMRRDEAKRPGPLQSDIDLGSGSGSTASESPLPPAAPKAALKKETPEVARAAPAQRLPGRLPQEWIKDIRTLKAEGKAEEAAFALAEFKKRYPDYVLPEDLR